MIYAYPFITLAIISLITGIIYLCQRKLKEKFNSKALIYSLAGLLLFVTLIQSVASDGLLGKLNGATFRDVYYDDPDFVEGIARIFLLFSEPLVGSLLIKDSKMSKKLIVLVSLPMMLLNIAYIGKSITYFTTDTFIRGIKFSYALGMLTTIIQPIIIAVLGLYFLLIEKINIHFESKKDLHFFIKFLVIGLLVAFPYYDYFVFFGDSGIKIDFGTPAHILYLVSIIVVSLTLYFLFRNESEEYRWILIGFLSVFIFIHHNSQYKLNFFTSRLPLQLCNLASYLILILAIIKKQKFFDFIYAVNPTGCVVAFLAFADPGDIFTYFTIHYLIQHLYVFIIPILMHSFKLFIRPNIKTFTKHLFIGFNIYFFVCLFLNPFMNTVIHNIANNRIFDTSHNFFYLLDCPVKDILPFYKDLEFGAFNLFKGQETPYYVGYLLFIYFVFLSLVYITYGVECGVHGIIGLCNRSKNKTHVS